jgi:hypothetical protein
MPDAACHKADVVIDRRQRAPARCTPERLLAAGVLRLAKFVCRVPLGDVIYRPVPKGLKAANRTLPRYRVSPRANVPNGSGGAIWTADTGPSVDSAGNIYVLAANGDVGTTMNANRLPSNGNFGNAFLKISTSRGLAVADYFEMQNQQSENNSDLDLGSGGALLLPDVSDSSGAVRHLAVGAGKDGHIYVVNRDAMGKFNSSANNIYQELTGVLGNAVFSMPAYFNNTIYYGAVGDTIKTFTIASAKVSTGPSFQSGNRFTYPGASASRPQAQPTSCGATEAHIDRQLSRTMDQLGRCNARAGAKTCRHLSTSIWAGGASPSSETRQEIVQFQ